MFFFKATILFLWTKRGLFCVVMRMSCWRPQLLRQTQSQQLFFFVMVNLTFSSTFFLPLMLPPSTIKPLQILHSNHWLWFHFSLRKQQAVHLRALREMKAGASGQGSKKKKKMLFPLSFQIPAGCDRVVNTQDKRQLCLLVLNIPIRLPTMAAFVCSHVRMRMKIPLPRLLCKNTIQS